MNWAPFTRTLGGVSKKTGKFSFKLCPNRLRLAFWSQEVPFVDPDATGFVEGLWRFDCAELFIAQPETGRYLEINFAPTGAWWSCVFSHVRKRDDNCKPPQLEMASAEMEPAGWTGSFELSFAEIERCLGSSENLLGNITLILGGCPDDDPPLENLHTVAVLGAVDFHRPHEWLPLSDLVT